jgi:hypothetical protein
MSKVIVERVLREARSAAASDHPNIVRIFDVARLGQTHYLVVEYVDGQTLDQMPTARGPVASGRAVEYASRQHRPIESVIIDEGFGCPDRQGRQVMIQELQNLRGHLHCILRVSHQEEVANAFADGYRFELHDGATRVSRFQRGLWQWGTRSNAPQTVPSQEHYTDSVRRLQSTITCA